MKVATSARNSREIDRIFRECKRLRLSDETAYLRNAAMNLINGMINMSFSCDGTYCIDHKRLPAKPDRFETPGQ